MASTVAERMWRESEPASIEADLSTLWMDMGRKGPIARAMMSNLLVVRTPVGEPSVTDTFIDAVAAGHPSRVLVIDLEPRTHDVAPSMTARVGIVAFGPTTARYGVEEVAVRSNCEEASLPSLVRRVARGNLPISVWWADDFSTTPLIAPLVELGRQLVFDSCAWRDVAGGFRALEPWLDRDVIDVNWHRLAPIRRALAFAARSCRADAWQAERVRIAHRPGRTALAWLAAGWLSSRLGWPDDAWPEIEETPAATEDLTIVIGRPKDDIVATLDRTRAVARCGPAIPSTVGVPQEDDADAIAAELHSLSRDACLHETLHALLRRSGR
jgi:glucose-6-phosphate dehydrogenase assembly protein OpcA